MQAQEPPKRETMSSKFCRKCGAKILRDSKYCEECGAPTSPAASETIPATKTTARGQAEITKPQKKQMASGGTRKATVGLVIICIVVLYAVLPVFIFFRNPDLDRFLTLTVSGGPCPTCHIESYFTLVLRSTSPWPISISHGSWDFLGVRWTGQKLAGDFTLMPFGAYTFSVAISSIMEGPAEYVHVRLRAEATMLLITDHDVECTSW
jgi:ribosomal protein L37E